MPKQTLRIEIPKNPEEQLKLAGNIYKKHTDDGADSVLKVMKDFKWDAVGPNIPLALAKHKEAEDLQKKMEKAYEDRNKLMAGIPEGLKSTRDFLKGVFSKSPKSLGDYGYTVDDSPRASKAPTTKK
ncbi:hypothetical protein ACFOW1_04890 [Parasediminibacterium paludis]|uniref:Uncharacterized protein n=1 Tax=Parasediminibacterium paludis TaxID=908966 RepID=A0ABV8PUF4_9BACT